MYLSCWEFGSDRNVMIECFDRCNVRSECGNGGMLGVNILIGVMLGVNVGMGQC